MTSPSDMSLSVPLSAVTDKPMHVQIAASAEDLNSLTSRFDLLEAKSVTAKLVVNVSSREKGILIEGHIRADIVQRCVATLDPVPDLIDETFDLLLVDEETAEAWDEQELYLEADHKDYDAFEGDSIPLGEIVAQTLSILMDDYPRAEGVEIAVPDGVDVNAPDRENPFDVLKTLKE